MRIGLDVGGTKTEAVAVDADGTIVARVRTPTGWGSEAVVATILDSIARLGEQGTFSAPDITSVGIGIPGVIDPDTGTVLHAVNLGVETLDLAGRVSAAVNAPCRVENDVKAAALGAATLREGAGSVVLLNLGTGVAAGVVVNGALWRGARGTAGEVGHISVDPHGRTCGCGQIGCIETLCGGGAVAKAWGRPGEFPIRDIFDAAEDGDDLAIALRQGIATGAAAAVRILMLSVDVETVVLGGGLTALGDRLLNDVREALRAASAGSAFLRAQQLDERIELLPSGSPAAALGAALVGAPNRDQGVMVHG